MPMTTLRIATLGAGNIGGTLGRKWYAKGHQVAFGVQDPGGERARALAAELGEGARITTIPDALGSADVVLFAIPGKDAGQTAAEHGAALDGKIILDATNNIGAPSFNSVAQIQAAAPSASVFRAFNTYGWENFADPVCDGVQADLFYAGPDGEARAVVEQLIEEVGLRPVRVGDSEQAGVVDGVLPLWFSLSRAGRGRHFALELHGS